MQRITFVTSTFYPEVGAAPSRLFYMAKALKNAGYEVDVITGFPNYPYGKFFQGYRNKFYQKEFIDGVKVIRCWLYPSHSKSIFLRFFTMVSFLFSALFISFPYFFKNRPSYIFTQSPPLLTPLLGIFYGKLFNVRVITNISDLWPSAIQQLGSIKNKFALNFLKRVEKFIYKSSFYCLAQSEEIKKHLLKYTDQVILYRTGVDLKLFLRKRSLQSRGPYLSLIYAGTLGLAQGVLDLCKKINFQSLGVTLDIYGAGLDKKELAQLSVSNNNINVIDPVDQATLPSILEKYDAALIPLKKSVYGTVPSKIYEAMAIGLPIFFHGNGEGAKLVLDSGSGLVSNPEDINQLIENIRKFKSLSQEEIQNLSKNGVAYASKMFDRKHHFNLFLNLLHSFEGHV